MSMRKIYRELAKKHGVNAEEVGAEKIRQEMQAALTEAYTDPLNNNEITKAYQNRVSRQGRDPYSEGSGALSDRGSEGEQGMNCAGKPSVKENEICYKTADTRTDEEPLSPKESRKWFFAHGSCNIALAVQRRI